MFGESALYDPLFKLKRFLHLLPVQAESSKEQFPPHFCRGLARICQDRDNAGKKIYKIAFRCLAKIDIVGCSMFRIFLVVALELIILVHATNYEINDIIEWNNLANNFANHHLHIIQLEQQAAFILRINCRSTRRYLTPRSSQKIVLVGIRQSRETMDWPSGQGGL